MLIYAFSVNYRARINAYVAVLIAVLFIGLLGRILFMSDIFGRNFRLISLSECATLLFGSTVYLFTKSSLQSRNYSREELWHYLPAVFYITFVFFAFVYPSDEVLGERIESGELFRTISIFVGFGLVFNFYYWIKSLRLFIQFRRELVNEVSYTVKSRFYLHFLITIGLVLCFWLAIYLLSLLGHDMLERSLRPYIWLSLAFIVLFITFYGLRSPELFLVVQVLDTRKYVRSKLSNADLDNLKMKLDALMEEKKPYLNRKLLKAELADMLGVSNPELARLLNERIGMNFFEYVNYHRIKEFVEISGSDRAKMLTFFGLAQEVGFNSKTTFNSAFKKVMGKSPKEYFNS